MFPRPGLVHLNNNTNTSYSSKRTVLRKVLYRVTYLSYFSLPIIAQGYLIISQQIQRWQPTKQTVKMIQINRDIQRQVDPASKNIHSRIMAVVTQRMENQWILWRMVQNFCQYFFNDLQYLRSILPTIAKTQHTTISRIGIYTSYMKKLVMPVR